MLKEALFRFVLGGIIVSAFSVLGDLFRPKSFAGLFAAAPSVALATLALALSVHSTAYAATEGRSMMAGAIALGLYSQTVSCFLAHQRWPTLAVSVLVIFLWLAIALGISLLL